MKFLTAMSVLILISLAWPARSPAEKDISDLEYRWADAQKTGNASVAEPLIAETFVNTDADGASYGKAQLLSNLTGGKWEINGISDVSVKIYGNAAVATGSWRGRGVDGDGSQIDRSERWTDTWVKTTNGKWQCVASQQTTLKKN
jgi:ketosteroid isomerase-like protein